MGGQVPRIFGHSALAGLVATHLFFVLSFWLKFPFMADDFIFLRNAANPADPYTLSDLGKFITRAPIYSTITFAIFKSRIWEQTWALMYVFFFIHAFSVALIVQWFLRELAVAAPAKTVVAISALVALLPSNHEVLYWPLCTPYVLGGLFVALGLWARSAVARTFWFFAAFAVLEAFVLASLALAFAPTLLSSARAPGPLRALIAAVRSTSGRLAAWVAALTAFFIMRKTLTPVYGVWTYELALNPAHFGKQAYQILEMLFVTHFYRINWASTLLELGALAFIVTRLLRQRPRALLPAQAAWLPLLLFASVANLLILSYYAPRAFYGGYLLRQAVVAWLVLLFLQTGATRRARRAAVACIALAYLIHTGVILANKHKNASLMAAREARWEAEMRACQAPCVIEAGNPAEGLKYDWILPEMFWGVYFEWLAYRTVPGKTIEMKATPVGD